MIKVTTNRYDHRIDRLEVTYLPASSDDMRGMPGWPASKDLQLVTASPNARHPGDWSSLLVAHNSDIEWPRMYGPMHSELTPQLG